MLPVYLKRVYPAKKSDCIVMSTISKCLSISWNSTRSRESKWDNRRSSSVFANSLNALLAWSCVVCFSRYFPVGLLCKIWYAPIASLNLTRASSSSFFFSSLPTSSSSCWMRYRTSSSFIRSSTQLILLFYYVLFIRIELTSSQRLRHSRINSNDCM